MKRTYNEKILQSSSSPDIVVSEATIWARNSLRETITKKLTSLKDKEYLSSAQYDKYIADYETLISQEVSNKLGTVYKSYIRLEDEIIANGVNVVRDAMNKKIVDFIKKLHADRKITEEKMNTWLVIIDRKIYQYKSDPDVVMAEVQEEAKSYTVTLAQSGSTTKIDSISDSYYDSIKKSSEKKFAKLSAKNLKNQLVRAKKTLKKYKEGTKQAKKQAALVRYLEEVIAEKESIKNSPDLKK